MFSRLKQMLIKEFIQILRDRKMRGMIVVAPLIQLVIFGYAATTDVRHIVTAVYDLDRTAASRELLARFVRSGHFDVQEQIGSEARVRELLDRGQVQVVLRVNHGFGASVSRGRAAPVQVLMDGTDSNTARTVVTYATRIVETYGQELLEARQRRLTGIGSGELPVQLESRAWFNDNLESRNFYVPGVIGTITMLITLMLTSMAIVRETEIGTMEQVMVTPIRPVEFILGKTLPFALIGMFDAGLVASAGVLWFRVPMRGSLLLLGGAFALFLLCTLGIGLLISTLCRTQQQAMMTTFFFFFPALMLSGFMFPIANMPRIVQWLTFANPLRYFLVIVRGIFLKGVGATVLWPQLLALALLGVATLCFATQRFRKTAA